MKNYYRIMLGRKSAHAEEAYRGGFIGADFSIDQDLAHHLSDDWRAFNKEYIPKCIEKNPGKTRVSAGLACGMLWTIAKGVRVGDVVLCPDGKGAYHTGEVVGEYEYHPGKVLPHRRAVRWFAGRISREELSEPLRNSAGSIGTVSTITRYAEELEALLSGSRSPSSAAIEEIIEDPSVFALEKHLEDFLVENWKSTELGKLYDIYEEDGELVGQQYPSDTGPIDILAISKDRKTLLVVELKKGRASDAAVGQIQRYMGYVQEELAEPTQAVRGAIIAFEDDIRVRRALSVARNIELYTYKIQFMLEKK
jgi:restriction system protein